MLRQQTAEPQKVKWVNFVLVHNSPFYLEKFQFNYQIIIETLNHLLKRNFRSTLIIPGFLLKLFEKKSPELIDIVVQGCDRGIFSLMDTAYDYVFLPLVPKEVIQTQIAKQQALTYKLFGQSASSSGFYPPALGINKDVVNCIVDSGYENIIIDELAIYNTIRLRNSEVWQFSDKVRLLLVTRVFQEAVLISEIGNKFHELGKYLLGNKINSVIAVKSIYFFDNFFASEKIKQNNIVIQNMADHEVLRCFNKKKSISYVRASVGFGVKYNSENPFSPFYNHKNPLQVGLTKLSNLALSVDFNKTQKFLNADRYTGIFIDQGLWSSYKLMELVRKKGSVDQKRIAKRIYEDLVFGYFNEVYQGFKILDERTYQEYNYYQKQLLDLNIPTASELGERAARRHRSREN